MNPQEYEHLKVLLHKDSAVEHLNSAFPTNDLSEENAELKQQILDNIDQIYQNIYEVTSDKPEDQEQSQEEEQQAEDKVLKVDNEEFEVTNEIPNESADLDENGEIPLEVDESDKSDIEKVIDKLNTTNESIDENKFERILRFNIDNFKRMAEFYADGFATKEELLKQAARVVDKEIYNELYESSNPENDIEIIKKAIGYLEGKLGTFKATI